ncbi:hypothetical protein LCGC14_2390380 [marine sediment metagenome]|uniref:Uncharacterized protein n=1 Tax=marine sediment metagenome TaxID=412755 RepID=A0A0F9ESX1_9ZZZZ
MRDAAVPEWVMSGFGWDYPPGVTGNEIEIAGPDYEKESDELCPAILWYGSECQAPTLEEDYDGRRWLSCDNGHQTDLEPTEPDQAYDEARDRKMLGIDRPDELDDPEGG